MHWDCQPHVSLDITQENSAPSATEDEIIDKQECEQLLANRKKMRMILMSTNKGAWTLSFIAVTLFLQKL